MTKMKKLVSYNLPLENLHVIALDMAVPKTAVPHSLTDSLASLISDIIHKKN